jgi:hypothetical protein
MGRWQGRDLPVRLADQRAAVVPTRVAPRTMAPLY